MSDSTATSDQSARGSEAPATRTVTGRAAGFRHAVILLIASCMSVLAATLLTPVLPKMEDAFAGTPGVAALVPITVTIPALMIGLLALAAGSIVDRLGRKRLLVVALLLYAVFGTMPLWLNSLPLIVVSRAAVGVTEAAIMTCCTTLIADYFSGRQRDRYIGLQVTFTNVSAILIFGLGGALGAVSWRAPFWLYSVSIVLAVLVALFISPPRATSRQTAVRVPIPWRTLAVPCVVTLFAGVAFYTPLIQLSFVLNDIGESTGTIGLVSAIASVATATCGILFGRVAKRGPRTLLTIAFTLSGIGAIVMAAGTSTAGVAIGAVIASAGSGLLLPTTLTWAISGLRYEERGRGTGVWTAAFSIGQFFCPLLILALAAGLTGRASAIVVVGVASLASGVIVAATLRRPVFRPAD